MAWAYLYGMEITYTSSSNSKTPKTCVQGFMMTGWAVKELRREA